MRGLCSIQICGRGRVPGTYFLSLHFPLLAMCFLWVQRWTAMQEEPKNRFFLESGAHKFVEALFDPTVRALQSGHVRPSTVCHFVLRATQTAAKMPASQRLVRPIIHRLFYILRCKASWSDWPRGQNVGLGLEHLASFNINRFHLYIVVL